MYDADMLGRNGMCGAAKDLKWLAAAVLIVFLQPENRKTI
jgi:hypothetical protein